MYCSTTQYGQELKATEYPSLGDWIKKCTYSQWGIIQPLKQWNVVTCDHMCGTRDHWIKWFEPGTERQVSQDLRHVESKNCWAPRTWVIDRSWEHWGGGWEKSGWWVLVSSGIGQGCLVCHFKGRRLKHGNLLYIPQSKRTCFECFYYKEMINIQGDINIVLHVASRT